MLAAENWCVKIDDKIYGPYSTPQMRKFAHEGRLASWSLVSPAGSRTWREARKESAFATFFGFDRSGAINGNAKAFGKRDDCGGETEKTTDKPPQPTPVKKLMRRAEPGANVRVANFVVIFDVVSAAASRVEAAILSLGAAFRIADNVWSVSCELTAVGVRNAIAPYLTGRESIFVVDTSRGRTSWQNYAPEAHAKISAAYIPPKH